ncbi:hypothetical protein CPB84DRAFT_1800884 [Gymnopilus junonius]|uniref:Fe2OG dioxygenase domain-containing protein n=1 Tax=Gymnopilus junonius TaxID=109634 RepID=A0A9P5NA55_GYMJU|nr:hypothetical protein CPB84DRAFT_1800884 [Gymnopilus junonius]
MSIKVEVIQESSRFKRKRSPSTERDVGNFTDIRTPLTLDLQTAISTKKPRLLRIDIPPTLNSSLDGIKDSEDTHSLFSASDNESFFGDLEDDIICPWPEDTPLSHNNNDTDDTVAVRNTPPVPGLFFNPSVVLPRELADDVVSFCRQTYFTNPKDNQVMLFGRFLPLSGSSEPSSGFPPIFLELLNKISQLLRPILQPETYTLLFPAQPTRARQAIINLYQPGEGITPHVNLLGRYGDGIIGVSFSSGSVMRFDKSNSTIARFDWTHGIDKKRRDFVSESESGINSSARWIDRGTRMSVTFRWMLPGADIVGDGP